MIREAPDLLVAAVLVAGFPADDPAIAQSRVGSGFELCDAATAVQ